MLITLAVIDWNLNYVDDKLHHFKLPSLFSCIDKTLRLKTIKAHIALVTNYLLVLVKFCNLDRKVIHSMFELWF